jgi:hypothetical protein
MYEVKEILDANFLDTRTEDVEKVTEQEQI